MSKTAPVVKEFSSEKSQAAMAAISWTYPQDQLIALQRQNAQAEAAKPVAAGIDVDDLHFR